MSPDVFAKMNSGKVLLSAGLVVTVVTSLSFSKTDVPLFLFSGQSNMVGLGTNSSQLSEEQKKEIPNIKIWGDNEVDNSVKKKWLSLRPCYGQKTSHFGVEFLFGKTIADSMPGKPIAFIKFAQSGTWLAKASEWLPPSSNTGTGGTLYQNMMKSIDEALKKFNDAFDTTQYTPKWAGFIWLQGEFDAMGTSFGNTDVTYANKYEENLTNLIKDIRTKTGVDDLPIILPMITTMSPWGHSAKIRDADVAMTKKLENCDTMDTKGYALADDKVHYNTASMIKVGTISAQRWLAMKYLDAAVPVINRQNTTSSHIPSSGKHNTSFDLTRRKIVQVPAGVLCN